MTLHLGKKPARWDSRDISYADVRPKFFSAPSFPKPHGGFGMDFGSAGWLMLGNGPCDDNSIDSSWAAYEGAGDCFWAGQAHSIMEATKNSGRAIPKFTCLDVLESNYAPYVAASNNGQGYDLQTGANDTGTDPREGLTRHQKTGILDAFGNAYKIGPYYSIEPGNFEQMWEALWLSECLGIGISPFPQSAMDQFNNGQTWTYVTGSPSDGGHWIILPGHPSANVWTGVTWGRRQQMTPQFITKLVDEVWAWCDPLRFNQITGKTVEDFDAGDVQQYLAGVAEQVNEAYGR